MDHHDEAFSPETVDEQIEQFLGTSQVNNSSAETVKILQGIYQGDSRLGKVWERLAERLPAEQMVQAAEEKPLRPSTIVKFPQQRVNYTQKQDPSSPPRKRGSIQRRLGLLAAVILTVILAGSLALTLSAHQSLVVGSGGPGTPTPPPTPACVPTQNPPVATSTSIAAQNKPASTPTPSRCSPPPAPTPTPSTSKPPTPTPTPSSQTPPPTPTPTPPMSKPPTPTPTPPAPPTPTPPAPPTPTPTPGR